MSNTLESPEEPSETLESEPIEQPEILEPEPAKIADAYDLETVELPEHFTTELPQNDYKFGSEPLDMICPECGVTMTTRTYTESTSFGNVDSSSFFFACLNFCCGGIDHIRHRCPACDAMVGTYAPPVENTHNYRSGSPNNFITNNGTEHVITQLDEGHRVECEAVPKDDDEDCLEVEDCLDDDNEDNLDGGDFDSGHGGGTDGDFGGGADE